MPAAISSATDLTEFILQLVQAAVQDAVQRMLMQQANTVK
jgi:hypothetical protein